MSGFFFWGGGGWFVCVEKKVDRNTHTHTHRERERETKGICIDVLFVCV